MKLTKSKLNQLIREALTETKMDFSWGLNPPGRSQNIDEPRPSRRVDPRDAPHQSRAGRALQQRWAAEEEAPKEDLFASLSKQQKELAEDMLNWWAEQIDNRGRISTLLPRLGLPQNGATFAAAAKQLKARRAGAEEDLKLILDALRNWPYWGGSGDELVPEARALALKIEEILSGEHKTPESEQDRWRKAFKPGADGPPEDEEIDPRFAHLEFDEALRRQQKGNHTMKLTETKLKQLIKEELEKIREMEFYDHGEEPPERLLAREIGEKVSAAIDAIAAEYEETSERGDKESWRDYVWTIARDAAVERETD